MEKFRYTKEWEDKCRQGIGWKESCYKCSYELLCLFQKNQEWIRKQSLSNEMDVQNAI